MKKIKKVVNEATGNITISKGKRLTGKTNDGIPVEWFIDDTGEIKTKVTSKRPSDFKNCWEALGVDSTLGNHIEKKIKLTWHHLDDLDVNTESSFQLVHRHVHNKTTNHLGSNFQIYTLLNLVE